jgi:glycosyltransferase involved in cell wall biosynthesis
MQISVIIPCKGRLQHLKECLPTVLAQTIQPLEIIVVDYDCPDKVSKWVKELNNTLVKSVKAKTLDKKYFNLSRARNEGYRSANGDTLFFCDADTLLHPRFFDNNLKLLKPGTFLCGWGAGVSTGNLIVARDMFEHPAIRGYNEALTSYGFDDIAIYARMEANGFRRIPFIGYTDNILHSDEVRNQHYEEKDIWRSNDINGHTASIKWEGI